MIPLTIILNGDGAWPEMADGRTVHHLVGGFDVAALEGGMAGGNPSVAFKFDLEDGSSVISETSLKLLLTAADAFRARYGDPR